MMWMARRKRRQKRRVHTRLCPENDGDSKKMEFQTKLGRDCCRRVIFAAVSTCFIRDEP